MLGELIDIRARDDDPLVMRRSRSLARLLLLLIGISILFALADFTASGVLAGAIINAIATLIFFGVYLINRSGRLELALAILLAVFLVVPISASAALGQPLPQIFFPCLTIVIAAAFGQARAPLIWAAIATAVPLLINVVLYRSALPPPGPVTMPDGASSLPLLEIEVVAVALYWMIAGVSWLAARQLFQTLDESRAATQAALATQEQLAIQQSDLAARNEQLTHVRQELEALVSALTVPVVPVADEIGLLPLVGALDGQRLAAIERQTLQFVSERRMRALVIDLSGATGMQAESARNIVRICTALSLLGVAPVLAGLGPQSALLLSTSNIALPHTVATVQDALAMLQRNS
jgi:rsbT co-antagonist protein RsbR